jgi:2-polyprenyl-6-methoxyphenol hydroxylase-like FAD-dependent oxidoreductase
MAGGVSETHGAGAGGGGGLHVLVAGGGIGGLTLAVALRQAGLRVTVFERAPALHPVGAGITVQANAVLALRRLGLAEAVAAEGREMPAVDLLAPSGRPLAHVPPALIQRVVDEVGASSVALHRGRLQGVLLAAAGEGCVETGRAVESFREEGGGVVARLSDGGEARGDVLVGADGLHSAVRRQLLGDGPPRYAGYTSWRAVVPPGLVEVPQRGPSETWGRGARFGVVPLGHGETYWYATLNAPPGGRGAPGQVREALLARFGDWHAPVRALLEATPEGRILRTDISDRPPAAHWSRGRVTLLGDAAHPMTPNMGQGGCQAIEDAVVLAGLLARGAADVPAALQAYEARRAPRANGIVRQSLRIGRVAQWEGAAACAVRDALIRLTPPSATVRQLRAVMEFPG